MATAGQYNTTRHSSHCLNSDRPRRHEIKTPFHASHNILIVEALSLQEKVSEKYAFFQIVCKNLISIGKIAKLETCRLSLRNLQTIPFSFWIARVATPSLSYLLARVPFARN